MKVIVAGPRDFFNLDEVTKAIVESGFKITELVSGCALGVDCTAETWAKLNNIPVKKFPANWHPWPKWPREIDRSAGFKRNYEMARYVGKEGALVALVNGSPGTANMIECATKFELQVHHYLISHIHPYLPKANFKSYR